MPLNDTAIRNAKSGKKPVKLSDGGGLYLLIQPHGTKLWRQAYRINGKQKTLAFGIYPTVSLADARAKRDAAKKLLEDGGDPSVRRKIDKQARGTASGWLPRNWSTRCGAKDALQRRSQKRSGCLILLTLSSAIVPSPRSPHPNCLPSYKKSKRAGPMKPHGGCAAPAAWCSAMPLPPGEPNETHRSIYAAR